MIRITVEEVLTAYKRTGLQPIRKIFFETYHKDVARSCACPLGALISPVRLDLFDETLKAFLNVRGLSAAYMNGFMSGFDGDDVTTYTEDAQLGVEDGLKVAEAVFGEGGIAYEPTGNVSGASLSSAETGSGGEGDPGSSSGSGAGSSS